ncbi:hypothetical protein N7532_006378 [Penicillium argentinense]|uniref:Uncharacterized protein n=1 Tax=Penicillium argentinense TaxID=1131581 RepID=A0A9W9KBW6_9EURO|nr:uncharacterized protein N7532_006378 [Penicillium argentinense]KAJ5099377.1 hypothetical protein N7532_006378 [Penicillium argentinense]
MPIDKTEKKRKRASDINGRPSKKPALELQALPPLKASVVEDKSELAPVIATTPGVQNTKSLRWDPYIKSRGNVSKSAAIARNPGIVSSEMLLQSSQHQKMDFIGREGTGEDADSQLKHYVAVVDPEQKTWQLIEARRVTLRGAVRARKAEEDSESEDEMNNMRTQREALTNEFGTKQSRKMVQSRAENAQLSSAPAGSVTEAGAALMSSMPADVLSGTAKATELQAEVQAAKPLPTPNLTAAHPNDVYPIENLVPGGHSTLRQLTGVSEWKEQVEAGVAVVTVSRYVSNRVVAVVKSENQTQLQILRFIQLLLEFARSLKGAGRQASSGPNSKRLPPRELLRKILSNTTGATPSEGEESTSELLPENIVDAVRRRFASDGSTLTKHDITLLHTTICAFSLGGNFPNELATDPSDLRDDLRLDSATMQQYFRELGCRIERPSRKEYKKWNVKGGQAEANLRRVARLRIPLEFPKVKRGGRA